VLEIEIETQIGNVVVSVFLLMLVFVHEVDVVVLELLIGLANRLALDLDLALDPASGTASESAYMPIHPEPAKH